MDGLHNYNNTMRLRRIYIFFVLIAAIVVLWKLTVIESGVDKLQVLKEALDLHKERLQLTQQQLLLLENLGNNKSTQPIKLIYAVTPTYWRYVQKAELTRISQTLRLVPNIHWIVIEDSDHKTDLVRNIIIESQLIATHLNAKTPTFEQIKDRKDETSPQPPQTTAAGTSGRASGTRRPVPEAAHVVDPRWKKHRGVEQRNMALKWLRGNLVLGKNEGVVYFMDDDNTYSIKLFDEIAKVKKVGVWPVGLVGGLNVETPILDSNTGKVTSFKSGWKPDRPFAVDMAGFAIHLNLILSNSAVFSYTMEKGLQESEFLGFYTTKEELEPLADNCTKVYVWHTRTEKPTLKGVVPNFEV